MFPSFFGFLIWASKETLHTIDRERWARLGVMPGSIEQLAVKLGGLRQNISQTFVSPNGQITAITTGIIIYYGVKRCMREDCNLGVIRSYSAPLRHPFLVKFNMYVLPVRNRGIIFIFSFVHGCLTKTKTL